MTLGDFDAAMQMAADIRRHANAMLAIADRLVGETIRAAGITHVDREAGFPCWTYEGANCYYNYYNIPREALAAKNKAGDEE